MLEYQARRSTRLESITLLRGRMESGCVQLDTYHFGKTWSERIAMLHLDDKFDTLRKTKL